METRNDESQLRVMAIIAFAVVYSNYMMAPLIPALSREFSVSPYQLGWLIPGFLLPYGISTLVYGALSDRWGRTPVLVTLLCFATTTMILLSLAGSWQTLLITRILSGVGCGGIVTIYPARHSAINFLSTLGSRAFLDKRWSSVYHHRESEGRPSSMTKQTQQQRTGLLQGTLDMLILRTLLYGPAHGHQIGKHIQRTTNDFLQMQHGSLYPALHRLEERGWVVSKWETAPDRNREFKYYRLTEKGKKQLVVEESQWKQMAEAVARVMWPAAEES